MAAVKTINVKQYVQESEEVFSRTTAKRILGISHPTKFVEHLQALGLEEEKITWDVLRIVLASRLFIAAGSGKHSKTQFAAIYHNGLMEIAFNRFNIDLEHEFNRIKDEYYHRQNSTS